MLQYEPRYSAPLVFLGKTEDVVGISDEVQRFSSSALESLNRGQWLSHHGPLESHCVWNCLERDFASFLNGFDGNP